MENNYTIEGHGDLARDPDTNSIVNVNKFEHSQYLARKQLKSKETEKVESIETDLANMKGELNEIKSLLKELVNGS
jgi:uncharacterized protein YqfB (UPF0267 family)|tara:strand:+ start:5406 stop:5633 length:228 start_codon:yes stop_codon:yes gene_type:complete